MLTSTRVETRRDQFPALPRWVGAIQHAVDHAPPDRLPQAVAEILRADVALAELLDPEQRHGCAEHYTRHVLYADPMGLFTVVALVWRAGQLSPIHGHYTWCSYKVLSGEIEEEHFAWDGHAGCARYQGKVSKLPGETAASHAGLDQIHRLRNAGAGTAISVHVYGVEGSRVATHVNRVVTAA
ncbi:cysteine dioxygenase family protein [Bordetella sp. BOR01]|uniref:cysteine dioxygenase family protein n=1 Tax=Bordetella sp. BOR01 TaxID=2854779 RepID=UPI001C442D07|nr:cysteine dioxygenase family protein [Bordetella sp. BOR01]MBV7484128.1 cysteine dioxygenase family protein [Bordetella sp. BOR01]